MYSFTHDVPLNPELYGKIRTGLGPQTPPGLVVHLAMEIETGLRYIDVWETEQDWTAFRDTRLLPVLRETLTSFGIDEDPAEAVQRQVNVIDAWVAAVPAHAG
jgi:hypothetical protein